MDHEQQHLVFSVRRCGQFTVYEPGVEQLDESSCYQLLAQMEPRIDRGDNLVLNFENVKYLGSAAMGLVATLSRRLRKHGAILRVCCLRKGPRHVFSLTNMNKVLDGIFTTEIEAVMFAPAAPLES